jgi:hypothetical protein
LETGQTFSAFRYFHFLLQSIAMSEQQQLVSPIESVSNVSSAKGKSNRPGKKQRQAQKSVTDQASSTTGVTSMSNAGMFARKASFTPTPRPGVYPIVFPSGAGEPTRDAYHAIDSKSLTNCLGPLPTNFIGSARYAEFSTNSSYSNEDFARDVYISALTTIAQRVVHAHTNMGLPVGDFSTVSSTNIYTMSGVQAIARQFGEFSIESLGTRYLYYSYESEIDALVRTAKRIKLQSSIATMLLVLKQHWLPTKINDQRTKFIIASQLDQYLRGYNVQVSQGELLDSLFSRASPAFDAVKGVLPENERNALSALFSPYATKAEFVTMFSGTNGGHVLRVLDLYWGANPSVGDLVWDVSAKVEFPSVLDSWLKKRTTIEKFFSCASQSIEKSEACGSPGQLSKVEFTAGVTIVRSLVALSAGEFSLLACFPVSTHYMGDEMRVVLTTSISTKVRAVEFLQRDWL